MNIRLQVIGRVLHLLEPGKAPRPIMSGALKFLGSNTIIQLQWRSERGGVFLCSTPRRKKFFCTLKEDEQLVVCTDGEISRHTPAAQ